MQRRNVPRAAGAAGLAGRQGGGVGCVGVDEVGRGAWAGPLLVVASRQSKKLPEGLRDSKLMSQKQREEMLERLSNCCKFGEGWVEADEIDQKGLAEALRTGFARALSALGVLTEEEIIIDGKINYAPQAYVRVNTVIDADQSVPLVSAASIYAKVARDEFMLRLAKKYPVYGFDRHVGYGTNRHRQALQEFGTLQGIHRFSYKPVKALSLGV